MFSSLTSFITSSISALPFRVLVEDVPHPSASASSLWKHAHGVRLPGGVSGAIAAASSGAAGEPISIFTFDKRNATSDQQSLARNAVQRLKTLRHPNIVKYIDSVDSPTHLHILTEQVTPLAFDAIKPSDSVGQLAASLGLYQITTTLSWLNNDAKLVHSNLHPGSLYTTSSGDWKLFGMELTHKGTEAVPESIVAGRNSGIIPAHYKPPELVRAGASSAAPSVTHSTDAWSLACLIFHTFNGNFSSPQQLAAPGNIPAALVPDYKKLLASNVANRLNPKQLLSSPFFQNQLVSTVTFLENLALHSAAEKDAFFTRFSEHVAEFPERFCKYKILPQLIASLDYGSGLTCFSAILRAVLRIGSTLNESEFAAQVIPCVVKLFSSNERAIRVHLLQSLPDYAHYLEPQLVNDSIFPHVLTGFADANAMLRELTVKSLAHFAPKLSQASMDNALRCLAKCQTDAEPAIRTNTGYCLAKIAPSLTPGTAERVLIPAFSKMMRDPFPPARMAGLQSFLATLDSHKAPDIARKILPVATPALADDSVEVRLAATKLVEGSLVKLSAWSAAEKARADAAMQANPNAMGSAPNAAHGDSSVPPAAAAVLANTGAVLGSLGSWAVGAVRSKMSNADANPPKHLASAGGSSNYSSTANGVPRPAAPTSASSSIVGAAAAAAASPSASSFNDDDDFFGEFEADDDSSNVAAVLSLGKKDKKEKPPRKDSRDSSKKEKKSILSGAVSAATAAATSSLDSWDFDDSNSSGAKGGNVDSLIDDFDSWGSSKPAAAAASSKPSSPSSPVDLLSGSSLASLHTKKPSNASAADPFASLSLATGASPKPAGSSPGGMTLGSGKHKSGLSLGAAPIAAKPSPLSSSSGSSLGGKKSGPDDWGDFLNS